MTTLPRSTYGTLDLENASGIAPGATRAPTAQRISMGLAFLVGCGLAFFGGRLSWGSPTASYMHAEVYDAASRCGEGQFIGGCTECVHCDDWAYAAGGCTYFKDTFCTLCEPIQNCPQENIRCSHSDDEVCLQCEPGYFDDDCKPCAICDLAAGFFEVEKCTQDSDTVCQKCATCADGEYMSKQCEYFTDRECSECNVCSVGTFRSYLCEMGSNDSNDLGRDTVCAPCSECEDGTFVSEVCSIVKDTSCATCTDCPCSDRDDCQYRIEECVAGEIFSPGTDTVCRDCTRRKDNEWEVYACGGTSDALFKECSRCQQGEYQSRLCTVTSDTTCPDCKPIPHCPASETTCGTSEDLVAGKYGANAREGEEFFDVPHYQQTPSVCDTCDEGFLGEICCYQKTYGNCGTTTVRERIAFRYGFDGETNDEFIAFCMELCGELPDCLAFEVRDGGTDLLKSGPNSLVTREAACYFKASFTKEPEVPEYDCYSNICRQGMHETGLVYY